MGADWYPAAARHEVGNHGGPMAACRGLVLHVQDGNNSLAGWFDDPASQVSAHFWVSKTGTVEQYVPCSLTAWAQAAGNSTWHSVETEGHPSETLSDAQTAALAALYRWGHAEWGWPYQTADDPSGSGFGIHSMGGVTWGNHPDCPSPLRAGQRTGILTAAQTPEDDVTPDDIKAISAQLRADLFADALAAAGPTTPIRQKSYAGMGGATYLKVGADQAVDAAELADDRSLAAAVTALAGQVKWLGDVVVAVAAKDGVALPPRPA